jgi:hypothetical protein
MDREITKNTKEKSLKRLAVFISGSGSNLQALIDAIQAGELEARIVLVASNRRDAFGLVRAERANIPSLIFPLKPYLEAGYSRSAYDADLADIRICEPAFSGTRPSQRLADCATRCGRCCPSRRRCSGI